MILKKLIEKSIQRVANLLPVSLQEYIISYQLPSKFQLEATTACNLRCALCPTHETPRGYSYLEMSHLENILRSCDGKVTQVNFHILGEPLMAPNLFSLVKKCSEHGIHTHFSTNGMLIHKNVDPIFQSGLSNISIAIDGIEQEDYEKYRMGGNFKKVIKNIQTLVEEKQSRQAKTPTIDVKTVMFSYNEDKEANVIQFLKSLGTDSFSLKRPNYSYSPNESEKSETFLAQVDYENTQRKYSRLINEKLLYRNQKVCPLLKTGHILSDGSVVACCVDHMGETAFGNLNQKDFKGIWRSQEHRHIIRSFVDKKLDICKSCSLSLGTMNKKSN